MSRRELIDIHASIRAETAQAWLLDDGDKEEWVPKSQAEQNDDGSFTMPLWLAEAKGFI